MQRFRTYLIFLGFIGLTVRVWAQFTGGSGNGDASMQLASTVDCGSFFGNQADGGARQLLPNPDPCILFFGTEKDGSSKALLVNPDSCGQFEGGLADGNGSRLLPNPVPCTAFFASQRDGAASVFLSCAPLTVNASELYGSLDGTDGYLWWYTYSEVNNLGFALERSDDQIEWTEIAFLDGQESSNARLKYTHWDRDMREGVNYYRWQQMDLSGERTVSNVVALIRTLEDKTALIVFPNPISNGDALSVHVQFASDPSTLSSYVVDAMGQIVTSQTFTTPASPMTFQMPTTGLAAGVYFLVLQAGGERLSTRFVVQ